MILIVLVFVLLELSVVL